VFYLQVNNKYEVKITINILTVLDDIYFSTVLYTIPLLEAISFIQFRISMLYQINKTITTKLKQC